MKEFVNGCRKLYYFEILDRLLGGLSTASFTLLKTLPELEHICVAHSSEVISILPSVLSESTSLHELIFFEDASYLNVPDDSHTGLTRWEVLNMQLELVAEMFPLVTLELRDDSHWLAS